MMANPAFLLHAPGIRNRRSAGVHFYSRAGNTKSGHQILLWCRRSISNEIHVMYNALYLIRFTVAEVKLKLR